MEDRKTLLANKPQRDEEDRRALERDAARNFGTTVEKYEHNFQCIYGTKPMKMDNEIAPIINMIGEDTEYTVPDGLTENMCIGLVKLKMMDEKIVIDVDLDNTKHVDDVDLCRNALETHAQEDVNRYTKGCTSCYSDKRRSTDEVNNKRGVADWRRLAYLCNQIIS